MILVGGWFEKNLSKIDYRIWKVMQKQFSFLKIHTRSQIAVESLQTVQIAFSNSADLSVMQKTEDSFLNASKMHCSLNNAEQRCLHMFRRQTLRKAFAVPRKSFWMAREPTVCHKWVWFELSLRRKFLLENV